MYRNSKVVVSGGSSTYVAGNSNVHNQIVHNHGSRPGFERLEQHVAAGALHNSGEVSEQPKCHPGTRVAILDHILGWAAAFTYTYPIIWLHGPAGAGKSAILRTIAQMLFERELLVASFFFFRSAARRNSSENFIATIAYQLALSIPATRPHIEQAIERNPLIFSLSLWDQAQELIVLPVLAASEDPSFQSSRFPRIIIVDGLDECHDPNKQCDILQVVCSILENLPTPFAVLIASRPEHHIRSTFDNGDLNRVSSRLSLDNSYDPDTDIENYLIDKFNVIKTKHSFKAYLPTSPPWPSREVIDQLVAKASGQFIYVSTVEKFVSSTRHNPAKRLDIILGMLDPGTLKPFEQLDMLYSTIFSTIDPMDLAGTLRVLGVLLIPYNDYDSDSRYLPSFNARSPAFLEQFLELESGDVRRLLFDLESLLTVGKDNESIRFFHASLSDYLFDRSRSGQFWIDAGMVYADLAKPCITHLSKSPEWIDFYGFFLDNCQLFFSKANPIPGLREAIESCNLASMFENSVPVLLQAIRNSTFSDAEELYRIQSAAYARIVEPKLKVYFQDTTFKYFLVATTINTRTFYEAMDYTTDMRQIFHLSLAMVFGDQDRGFKFLSSVSNQALKQVIKDLLSDPQGEYFIDENQYADIALYLLRYMNNKSGVEATMNLIFPPLLSKSPVRRDLTEYILSTPLNPAYVEYTDKIENAINEYLLRSEAHEEGIARDVESHEGSLSSQEDTSSPTATHHEQSTAPDTSILYKLKVRKPWWTGMLHLGRKRRTIQRVDSRLS